MHKCANTKIKPITNKDKLNKKTKKKTFSNRFVQSQYKVLS